MVPRPLLNPGASRRLGPWALLLLTLIGLWHVGAFRADWAKALRNLGVFVADAAPTDADADLLLRLAVALLETVEIAFLGTILAAALALPLACLAARNLSGGAAATGIRGLFSATRTIPSLLWALVFVVMVGREPALAGTLGISAYSLGYLGRLYADILEGVNPEILEALSTTGASRWRIAWAAAVPEAAHLLLSQTLFVFEYNIRASSIVGFVGAGGIGAYLALGLEFYNYELVATALLILLAFVFAVELAGGALRKRYLPEPMGGPA